MRLQAVPDASAALTDSKERAHTPFVSIAPAAPLCQPTCDIGEALSFTLRHTKGRANAKQVALSSSLEANLLVACDRQVGRRILRQLVDCGLNGSEAGGRVSISGRRVKGVGLLRVESEPGTDPADVINACDRPDISTLRELVDSAAGTLVVDRQDHKIALSVRLELAISRGEQVRVSENVDSG